MKVAHLTTVHPEDDIRIYQKEARFLAQYYDVSLIAPRKGSHIFSQVHYFPLSKYESRFSRLLSQQIAYHLLSEVKPKVVHIHDPELFFLAILLKFRGFKIVWDVHENLPYQILNKTWIPSYLRSSISIAAHYLEILAGIIFDRIVVVTKNIAESFPAHKTVLVQNFPILGELGTVQLREKGNKITKFVHAGVLSKIRGIIPLINSFEIVNNDLERKAKLVLIGRFESSAFEEECRASPGWKYVDYHSWVERQRLAGLLSEADAGIVTFLPVPNHTSSQPNKMFEYMSIGLPLIVSDFPLWRELVADRGSGLMVDPSSPQAIAEAIVWLVDHPGEAREMGERGHQAVLTEFNWDAEFEKLLVMYRELENE